jgi:ABC-2 type transport system permease protein
MIAIEATKQIRRPLGWIVLAVMAGVPIVLTVVIALTAPALPERVGDFGSVVSDQSGLTAPLLALNAMVLFLLPLAVAIFAGQAVAGEAAWGSLRYLCAHPISRSRLLATKGAVAAAYAGAAVLTAVAASLLCGVAAFGWRPLTVVDLERTTAFWVGGATFPPAVALQHLAIATLIVAVSLTSTFAFGLLLSTSTRSAFAAAAGAVGLGIVSRALDNIPGLSALGPWLPMTDAGTTLWTGAFTSPTTLTGLPQLVWVQTAYTAVFLFAAWWRFRSRDILW